MWKHERKTEWCDFFGQLWSPAWYPNQTSMSSLSLFRMTMLFLLRNLLVGVQHMSKHFSPPPAEPTLTQFSLQLVTHTKVSSPTPAGKPTQKNKKDVKSKELSFACTDANYLVKVKCVLLLYESSNKKHIIGGEFVVTVSEMWSMWIGRCAVVFIIAKSVINHCLLDSKNLTSF
jgi:hypothetical protein